MQVSRIWQEIADQKAENHGSPIDSNTFSPFYFDVIILSCYSRLGISPILAGALFMDTVISPTFYRLLTVVITVYTLKPGS